MKKGLMFVTVFLSMAFSVSAIDCTLDATLINQDPYPAIPGEYVKVVFQLTGVSNPECGDVSFRVTPSFPFSLDPGVSDGVEIISGTYSRDYSSALVLPFNIRVHPDAVDGENELEVRYYSSDESGQNVQQIEKFDISIEGVDVDFEVYVGDFDSKTNTLSIELLNIGEDEAEAVVLRIPKQEIVQVKGSNFVILGDLDSQEETSADFEAVSNEGEITLEVLYTDSIGERRTVEKKVYYDPSYFVDRKEDEKQPTPTWYYVVGALVLIWIVFYIRRRIKKKRDRMNRR